MNGDQNERLDVISSALARLDRRQQEMLRRLERLESAAGVKAASEESVAPPVAAPAPLPAAATAEAPAPERPRGFETRMGLTLVNRVGVVTLVLGAAFFFRYAVEAGWLGVNARVLLGAVAGLAALALGERIWRTGQHVYSVGITGAGIGILYLTVYAAFGLYGLVAQAPAFLLMALTTAAAVGLSLRYNSAALAALGLFGGYATPLLLSPGGQPWFVLGYVLLLDVGVLYTIRRCGWHALESLAFLGTVWVYGAELDTPVEPARRAGYTLFALAYYGVFAAMRGRWIGVAGHVLAALALAVIWGHSMAPFMGLALLLAVAGLAIADRRGWALPVLAAFWLSYGLWAEAEKRPVAPLFWFLSAAFVLFGAWLPWRVWVRRTTAGLESLLVLALNAGAYFAVSYALLSPLYRHWAGPLAVVMAALHMALAWRLWERDSRAALLAAGAAWALLVLAVPAHFAGYRVTVIWALEGAALAWTGARLREVRATYAALAVFALVLLRLGVADAWAYPSPRDYGLLLNARFVTFLLSAACLWASARWTAPGWPAAATYVTGHFVALWGLGLEAFGWAGRTAAVADLPSVESTALSIVMAAYAVGLVSLGVFTGTVMNRVLGLGLIGVVVLKLYLHDVWFLGLFYRMAAFAVLGALLLVMSYLYSRFRVSIESWWRDRRAG
ncbi:MAG TPA: DUF2339 domain-containing protein [Bryobacteraceae bacterium]|nr:DUF2339 domain-containing protein [Bryobacteraceae bacterium]